MLTVKYNLVIFKHIILKRINVFNLDQFDIKLNTNFIGRNFIYAEEIDSTNSYLLAKENNININGTVLLAEKQLSGKGRFGRTWISNKGQNLTFSILITDKKILKKNLTLLNFISSLAVALSIENLLQLKVELKWPNDVLINKKKTAGILIQSVSSGNNLEKLVIGIGINVNQNKFTGNFNFPPTSLKNELKQNVNRERFLAEVLNNFEEILKHPGNVLNEWRERCHMIGDKICIIENNTKKYGIFDDIDESGCLLLKQDDKIEKIHFGEVSLT